MTNQRYNQRYEERLSRDGRWSESRPAFPPASPRDPPPPLTMDEVAGIVRPVVRILMRWMIFPFLPVIIPAMLMISFVQLWGEGLDQKAQWKERKAAERRKLEAKR